MESRRRHLAAFTLFEIMLVIAILGAITATLTAAANTALARASDTQHKEERLHRAYHLLEQIKQAIRMAESVHQAGDNLLVISTRYYYDTDDALERVRFSLSGRTLLREISQNNGASYAAPEVLDNNVASFMAYSFRISDPFDPGEYDLALAGIPTGDPSPVDSKVQAEFLVKELGQVDQEFKDSYSGGQLQITTTNADPKRVTVSPPLSKDGLQLRTQFTPLVANSSYRPLRFGLQSVQTSTMVLFENTGKVVLRSKEADVLLAQQYGTADWIPGETYFVEVHFNGSNAWARVITNTGDTLLSQTVPTSNALDNAEVDLTAGTQNNPGSWDDLRVGYPRVTVEIGVDIGSGIDRLTAKVAPRAW
ncbi:MAG: hypothetical protein AAF581_23745 [Planctomycetota bacterium]